MTAKLFTWDWKAQPPMTEIAAAVSRLSAHGRQVHMHEVDTESDQYAWIVSDVELTDEQAQQFFGDDERIVLVEVTIEPNWTIDHHREVIEVDLGDLIGLEDMARHEKIIELASNYVNEVASWGASELAPGEENSDD